MDKKNVSDLFEKLICHFEDAELERLTLSQERRGLNDKEVENEWIEYRKECDELRLEIDNVLENLK